MVFWWPEYCDINLPVFKFHTWRQNEKKYDGLRQDETWNYNSYFKMPNIATDSAGGAIYLEAQSNVLNIKIL